MAKEFKAGPVEYTLFLHWKQGDDYYTHAFEKEGEVQKPVHQGLLSWAKSFDENATHLRRLAGILEGKDTPIQAGTHHIAFDPNNEEAQLALEEAARQTLLSREDTEYEDEDCDE